MSKSCYPLKNAPTHQKPAFLKEKPTENYCQRPDTKVQSLNSFKNPSINNSEQKPSNNLPVTKEILSPKLPDSITEGNK